MTERRVSNIAASVRQRLLNLRDAQGTDYNALLTQYAIERFLYRLAKSRFAADFVLKGAMLFRVWSGNLHRPTKDLDLLGHGDPTPDAVAKMIRHVIATPVPDDGLTFDETSVDAREIRDEQEYGGIRVKLVAHLGNARIPMQIDVGFGDAITPEAQSREYPTLLDDAEAPTLQMYPPETVVAEKVEAAVALGMTNSRMKDYYDLIVLLRNDDLTEEGLAAAMAATFRRRQTALPEDVPPGFSDEFGEDAQIRRLWNEFCRRMQIDDAPAEIGEVVRQVRDRIWPALMLARRLTAS